MILLTVIAAAAMSLLPPPAADAAPAPSARLIDTASVDIETHTIKTPRFQIVHTDRSAGAARYLAKEIEQIRDDIANTIGRDWKSTTEVRLGFDRREYEALALPNGAPPPWAVALAYPKANIILVNAPSLSAGDGQATLRHELVHVALGQLGDEWPHWFQEGLAQHLTGERMYRFDHFVTMTQAVATERIFNFDDLSRRFPSSPDDVAIAYAQSAAFIRFLVDRHGSAAFGVMIDRVGAGDAFEKAFGIAFRAPLSTEERAFRAGLGWRYPAWALALAAGTPLWIGIGFLLVGAYFKRRQSYEQWKTERRRIETLEDLALYLTQSTDTPMNDDGRLEVHASFGGVQRRPWFVSVFQVLSIEPSRAADARFRRPGT